MSEEGREREREREVNLAVAAATPYPCTPIPAGSEGRVVGGKQLFSRLKKNAKSKTQGS